MKFFQITIARMRSLEETWRSSINRFRGPIPLGLAIGHMIADSNGVAEPTIRDAIRRPIGLMGIPRLTGLDFKYTEEFLVKPVNNIYVWARALNKEALRVHTAHASTWATPDYDFWLAVRLSFLLGDTTFDNVIAAAVADGSTYKKISGMQTWVRTKMDRTKRFGRHRYRDMNCLMDHLDGMQNAMLRIDGPDKASYAFSEAPPLTPGTVVTAVEATAY